MGKKLDLVGQRFGSLVVLEKGSQDKNNRFKWLCKCDCGNTKEIHGRHLVNGKTITCGCQINVERPKPALGKTGPKHPKWKGGRFYNGDGYVLIYVGEGEYEFEHRLVAGATDPRQIVHHINGVKDDNRLENLEIMDRSSHAKEHDLGKYWKGKRRSKKQSTLVSRTTD